MWLALNRGTFEPLGSCWMFHDGNINHIFLKKEGICTSVAAIWFTFGRCNSKAG